MPNLLIVLDLKYDTVLKNNVIYNNSPDHRRFKLMLNEASRNDDCIYAGSGCGLCQAIA
jgi:hypothetical protein